MANNPNSTYTWSINNGAKNALSFLFKASQEYFQWYKTLAQMVNQLRYLERSDR